MQIYPEDLATEDESHDLRMRLIMMMAWISLGEISTTPVIPTGTTLEMPELRRAVVLARAFNSMFVDLADKTFHFARIVFLAQCSLTMLDPVTLVTWYVQDAVPVPARTTLRFRSVAFHSFSATKLLAGF